MSRPGTHPPATVPGEDPRVRRVELIISTLLRTGVILSLSVVALGTVVTFVRHPDYLWSRPALKQVTQPGVAFPDTMREVIGGLGRLEGRSIVVLGLLLLIATPVMRVAVSIVTFLYQRDRLFAVVTLAVLIILLVSFVLGRVE